MTDRKPTVLDFEPEIYDVQRCGRILAQISREIQEDAHTAFSGQPGYDHIGDQIENLVYMVQRQNKHNEKLLETFRAVHKANGGS